MDNMMMQQEQGDMVQAPEGMPSTPQGTQLFNEAIKFVYGEKLDAVTKFLSSGSPDKLPARISKVINNAIKSLEKKTGETYPIELAAEVGFKLFDAIVEDMVGDEIIPPIGDDVVAASIAGMISDYALMHKDTVRSEDLQMFLQQLQENAGAQTPQEGSGAEAGMPPEQAPMGMPPEQSAQPSPQPQQGLLGAV